MKLESKKNLKQIMEDYFAAAALAEGSPEMARSFLNRDFKSSLEAVSEGRTSRFEQYYAAAALAEGGAEMAREYLNQFPESRVETGLSLFWNKMKQRLESLERTFAAIGLAEECSDAALAYLNQKSAKKRQFQLNDFLVKTGLKGVPVRYAVAMI